MKHIQFDNILYYESADNYIPLNKRSGLQKHSKALIKCFTRRRVYKEVITHYYRTGLERYVLLKAHGGKTVPWKFWDGKKKYLVQKFIDRHDEDSLAILLYCCNPSNQEIRSEHSIIIHPRANISVKELVRGNIMRMYVPKVGYLDYNYYHLEKALRELMNNSLDKTA